MSQKTLTDAQQKKITQQWNTQAYVNSTRTNGVKTTNTSLRFNLEMLLALTISLDTLPISKTILPHIKTTLRLKQFKIMSSSNSLTAIFDKHQSSESSTINSQSLSLLNPYTQVTVAAVWFIWPTTMNWRYCILVLHWCLLSCSKDQTAKATTLVLNDSGRVSDS